MSDAKTRAPWLRVAVPRSTSSASDSGVTDHGSPLPSNVCDGGAVDSTTASSRSPVPAESSSQKSVTQPAAPGRALAPTLMVEPNAVGSPKTQSTPRSGSDTWPSVAPPHDESTNAHDTQPIPITRIISKAWTVPVPPASEPVPNWFMKALARLLGGPRGE